MEEKKEKTYVSNNAQLMAEWNWEKNNELNFNPRTITLGNKKIVWWKCPKGHEWQSAVSNRKKGSGCPYCSGRYPIKGENDLETINPTLAQEWNYEKNNGLTPMDVLPNSNKKVWWKCRDGHEWQATILNRNKGRGCPYCSNKIILKGENDLETVNPTLAREWDFKKNGDLKPDSFSANSGQKVWWKCNKGHEWLTTIDSRNNGHGCPYCAGQKALRGENDLQTVNPNLAKEWHYEKNKGLTPEDVLPSSNKKVWWQCRKGHEWQSTITNRNKGVGCPICNSERNTSFPEYAIVYYLKNYGLDVIHSYKEQGYELDVYIPSKKIAIEYDGSHWHENKTKSDLEKNQKCKKEGIKLYRIREKLPPLNDSSIDYIVKENQKNLSQILEEVLSEILGSCVDVDIERDTIDIENLREYTEKENSILFSNPKVANEWHYEKNRNLKPEYFAVNSHKKVWWKCKDGHEWQATISNRNIGHGCPYCVDQKVLKGYNDLKSVNPTLSNEWNYEKNNGLTPNDVTSGTNKKVWWKCVKGHEWQAMIASRNKGVGCPYCSGQKAIKGENDLQTINPSLSKEWNYEKNNGLTPMDVMSNSGKKVWWKCVKGHEWQAMIASRNKGAGCPYCSGQKVIKGCNDLNTVNPILAKEWNCERNQGLSPKDLMPNSNKKVWWKCEKGHEWKAIIAARNSGIGCPFCSGKKVLKGYNDLKTVNPTLAKEWNYKMNGLLKPEFFTSNSGKKVWWKCVKGHEWKATIDNRSKGRGCPYCSGRNAIEGENDLNTVNPNLAKEWNHEKNNGLTPMDVKPNSNKKVWWKCNSGHEWQAIIQHRNNGNGCPVCAKEKRSK